MRAVELNGLLPPLRVLLPLFLLLLVVLAAPAIADDGVGQQQQDDDVRALVEEGRELVDTRRFDEAAATLERALALDPGCPGALVQLGRASAFQGGYDEAAAQYALALEADPSYAPAMTALGKLHAFRGRHDEALAAFEGALAAVAKGGAEEADALLGLARLTAQASRDPDGFQRAEALYGRGLAITPENEQALFDQGLVLSQLGKHEDAHASFQAAIALNAAVNYTLLGGIYGGFEQHQHALEAYGAALDEDPSDVASLFGYAQSAESLALAEEAQGAYEALLTLAPGHAQAHYALGALLTGTGRFNYAAAQACGLNRDAAMTHFRRALELEPGLEPAEQALAFCEAEAREEALWAERVAALKEEMAGALKAEEAAAAAAAAAADAVDAANADQPASTALQEAAEEEQEGALAAGASPVQVLRTVLKRQLRGLFQLLRRLGGAASALLARLQGKPAASRGGEDDDDFGRWIQGQRIRTVPRVHVKSGEDLMRYVRKHQPVVITNFEDDYAPPEAWTREALKAKFGRLPVRVSLSQTGRFDGPEDGTLWGLGPEEEVLVRPPQVTMRFGDLADLLHLSAVAHKHGAASDLTAASFYLEYLSLAQYLGPEMLAMVPMPQAARESGMEHFLTNFWMGKGNTTSPLHYDDYENLLCQVLGSKELTLFPPSDIAHLYYTGRAKGLLEYEHPGQFTRRTLATAQGVNVVFGSSVYLDAPDLSKHPELPKATPYKVRLRPGSVLYLPSYWHHEVASHPDAREGLNIAVNYWFRNETSFAEEAQGLAAAARHKKQRLQEQQQQQQQQQEQGRGA